MTWSDYDVPIETTKQKYDKLHAVLELAKERIIELQEECTHPNISVIPKSDSGNWDYSVSYWVSASCPDCMKKWVVYSDKDRKQYLELLSKRK